MDNITIYIHAVVLVTVVCIQQKYLTHIYAIRLGRNLFLTTLIFFLQNSLGKISNFAWWFVGTCVLRPLELYQHHGSFSDYMLLS